jgi:DNA repair photolyase
MIISASYKTDIPAFYGAWFMERLAAGWCETKNPYNRRSFRVSLARNDVDGFVFWTRNIKPFLPHLSEIAEFSPFTVQYTITNYPRCLETSVVSCNKSIANMRQLAAHYGPRTVVWRYDPILFTSLTPAAWHEDNFGYLVEALASTTDEVVVSFAHIYRKTKRNLAQTAVEQGFRWHDPDAETKRNLLKALNNTAAAAGLRLTLCAQKEFLVEGVNLARCIDATRLSDVAGFAISANQKGNRPDCLCQLSKDIGAYDCCPHGCRYCYAVNNHEQAKIKYQAHQLLNTADSL